MYQSCNLEVLLFLSRVEENHDTGFMDCLNLGPRKSAYPMISSTTLRDQFDRHDSSKQRIDMNLLAILVKNIKFLGLLFWNEVKMTGQNFLFFGNWQETQLFA